MKRSALLPLLPLLPALLAACTTTTPVHVDETNPCHFSVAALQFRDTPPEQASCLLRHVDKWGKVQAQRAVLPPPLAQLIGQPTGELNAQLRRYVAEQGYSGADVGGDLSAPLSHANGGDAAAPGAHYFVIHDTSSPWLGDAHAFPPNGAASLNALQQFVGPNAVAHVFVNRLGETVLGHDFSEPWRATKFETRTIGQPAKGLFIHIELLQPRRRDPSGSAKNDAIAPTPGFTTAQYEKLALLYAAASSRSGTWLIPAFHADLDQGLEDAHDDPQNFEMQSFVDALTALRERL